MKNEAISDLIRILYLNIYWRLRFPRVSINDNPSYDEAVGGEKVSFRQINSGKLPSVYRQVLSVTKVTTYHGVMNKVRYLFVHVLFAEHTLKVEN